MWSHANVLFIIALASVACCDSRAGEHWRARIHFQPHEGWMNDPNGPVYFQGEYHLFFQYVPGAANPQGTKVWGHATSTDLVHWQERKVAIHADTEWDIGGVFSGSILHTDPPLAVYTCVSADGTQRQCAATAAQRNSLDEWTKFSAPLAAAAPSTLGVPRTEFRDPSETVLCLDGKPQCVLVGASLNATVGAALLYRRSADPRASEPWRYEGEFHTALTRAGRMWECPDLACVRETCILKVSGDKTGTDFYGVGSVARGRWRVGAAEVGASARTVLDYGTYYAGKSFYDPTKDRRVYYGWMTETMPEVQFRALGWAGAQAIPRELHVIRGEDIGCPASPIVALRPIDAVRALRTAEISRLHDAVLAPGEFREIAVPLPGQNSLDIEADVTLTGEEAAAGFHVFACDGGIEATRVGMYFGSDLESIGYRNGPGENSTWGVQVADASAFPDSWHAHVYHDMRNSSTIAESLLVQGGPLRPYPQCDTALRADRRHHHLRTLVDGSIVETFVDNGIARVSSRAYPREACSRVFLFNASPKTEVKFSNIHIHVLER